MKDMETDEYAQFTAQETILNLSSDEQNGLSSHQVQRLLEEYGYNQIPVVEESVFRRIAKRFWGPIPWMIEVSAGLSLILHKWEDFAIILVMLCLNAFLDFFQEHRALNVLKALRQKSTIDVTVLRDGHQHRVAITELVPGDIVLLRIGDMVPADVQLLDGDYLSIDESSLTGESLAVVKTANQVAYANTVIKQGEMRAVVINTGTRTRFSSVVDLVAQVSLTERSHFQKVIIQIGNFLIVLSMLMVALILVVGVFRHEDMMELVRFTMILAVASIPVALPAVLSVTMAVGAINLAKKQAIVSRLTSIEELAGVDIFCSDKTGTLTKNEMKVMTPITFNGYSEKSLLLYALLASRKANNDPIELPLFHHWSQEHSDQEWQAWQQSTFTPFNPKDKYTSALVSKEDVHLTVYKALHRFC
jgi:H+-transporting ATPase